MVFSKASRQRAREAEPLWLAKLILRIIAIVLAIVTIGLGAYTWATTLAIIWLIIPVAFSLIWNIANIIVRMVRARPMHPGANVGMDLVITLLFIVFDIFGYLGAVALLYLSDFDGGYYYDGSSGGYYYSNEDCSDAFGCDSSNFDTSSLHHLGAVAMAACVFASILLFIHLTLFIWACVDTHQRRRRDRMDFARSYAAYQQNVQPDVTTQSKMPMQQQQPVGGVAAPNPQGNYGQQQPQQQPQHASQPYGYPHNPQAGTAGQTPLHDSDIGVANGSGSGSGVGNGNYQAYSSSKHESHASGPSPIGTPSPVSSPHPPSGSDGLQTHHPTPGSIA